MYPTIRLIIGFYIAIAMMLVIHGFAIWREERVAGRLASTVGIIRFSPALGAARTEAPQLTEIAHISYEYSVAGRQYHSRRFGFGSITWRSYRAIVAYLETIRSGSRVTVYYDPGRPQHSVLDRRTSMWDYAPFIGIGAALLVIGPALFQP